jgi:low temperature requirement protein LtrA
MVVHGQRHASWLELFFDLVFVVAVAVLGHLLYEDTTARGFVMFAWLFIPVWWLWIAFSYYADQFDNDDLRFYVVIHAAMLGIIVLAVNIDAAAHGSPTGFVLAYVVLRLLLTSLYLWARKRVPAARALCTYIIVGSSLSVLLWFFSLYLAEPYGIWALALLIESIAAIAGHLIPTRTEWQNSHMPERLGLFTILVLGEAVLAVANGAGDVVWNWNSVITAVSGFLVATCIWWLYFGYVDESTADRALHGTRGAMLRGFVYAYSHLLIFASIIVISVGIGLAIDESHEPSLQVGTRVALFGGLSTTLVGMTMVDWATPYGIERNVLLFRVGLVILFVILACASATLSSALLLGVGAMSMVVLLLFEIFSYKGERETAPFDPMS